MLSSGLTSRLPTKTSPLQLQDPLMKAKPLVQQLEEEILPWDGPALSFSPFSYHRSETAEVFTNELTVSTPENFRSGATKRQSSANQKGSASSPISLSSSSPSPLPRPRAAPIYASPLPRSAFTPTRQPLHPFFNAFNARQPIPPPSPSKPRIAFAFSSSSASSSSSSTFDSSASQEEITSMLTEISLNEGPRRASTMTKYKANTARRPLAKTQSVPCVNMSATARSRTHASGMESKEKTANGKIAEMLKVSLNTSIAAPLADLPLFSHSTFVPTNTPGPHRPPAIVYTRCPLEADDLLSCLSGPVLGFDLEWPTSGFQRPASGPANAKKVAVGGTWIPSSTGGKGKWKFSEQRTALVQVCDENMVVLIHVHNMKELPSKVRELVSSRTTYKTGVQVAGDGKKLVRDFEWAPDGHPKGLLELSWIARKVDPLVTGPGSQLISLANLSRMYLRHELDKGSVRISDWSKELSPAQREYAANDVYASLQIYLHLKRLATERGIDIDHDACSTHLGTHKAHKTLSLEDRSRKSSLTGPPHTQAQAYDYFASGLSFSEIAAAMNIKETTAHTYVLNVARDFTPDDFDHDTKRRLMKALPTVGYFLKSHASFLQSVRSELEEADLR